MGELFWGGFLVLIRLRMRGGRCQDVGVCRYVAQFRAERPLLGALPPQNERSGRKEA